MKKDRNITFMLVVMLLLTIVTGVSFTYAAYTRELVINGTASAKKMKWDIHFSDLSAASVTGGAREVTSPLLTDATKLQTYKVEFSKPNSSISYTFNMENAGTFDATLSSITPGSIKCTESGEADATDAQNVCDNLEYKLVYSGSDLNGHHEGDEVKQNDTLNAGAKASLKLTLTYKDVTDPSKLPKDDIDISGLDMTLTFTQK